jgi:hypothetical protein
MLCPENVPDWPKDCSGKLATRVQSSARTVSVHLNVYSKHCELAPVWTCALYKNIHSFVIKWTYNVRVIQILLMTHKKTNNCHVIFRF